MRNQNLCLFPLWPLFLLGACQLFPRAWVIPTEMFLQIHHSFRVVSFHSHRDVVLRYVTLFRVISLYSYWDVIWDASLLSCHISLTCQTDKRHFRYLFQDSSYWKSKWHVIFKIKMFYKTCYLGFYRCHLRHPTDWKIQHSKMLKIFNTKWSQK